MHQYLNRQELPYFCFRKKGVFQKTYEHVTLLRPQCLSLVMTYVAHFGIIYNPKSCEVSQLNWERRSLCAFETYNLLSLVSRNHFLSPPHKGIRQNLGGFVICGRVQMTNFDELDNFRQT